MGGTTRDTVALYFSICAQNASGSKRGIITTGVPAKKGKWRSFTAPEKGGVVSTRASQEARGEEK